MTEDLNRRKDDNRIELILSDVKGLDRNLAIVETEIRFVKQSILQESSSNKEFQKYMRDKLNDYHSLCVSKEEHKNFVNTNRWIQGTIFTVILAIAGTLVKVMLQ